MGNIIKIYLQCLEEGNYEKLISYFSEDAIVTSPLYGERKAADFYRELFSATSESDIELLDIFTNERKNTAAAHFQYNWTLSNGEPAPFEVVDVFEFDEDDKIKSLKIIYDAEKTREKFNTL